MVPLSIPETPLSTRASCRRGAYLVLVDACKCAADLVSRQQHVRHSLHMHARTHTSTHA
jgi:hypothetical protein